MSDTTAVRAELLTRAGSSDLPTDNASDLNINMRLAPSAVVRLQNLMEFTDSTSYSEVVRRALQLYEFTILEAMKGRRFGLIDRDNTIKQVQLFHQIKGPRT